MPESVYNNLFDERTNKYENNFFHIYLEGESPITNLGYKKDIDVRDYASFIHEYIHYIQQITTPYGLKFNNYFTNKLLLYRNYLESNTIFTLPIELQEEIKEAENLKIELTKKYGSRDFKKGNIDDIEINNNEIILANKNGTAVSIGVYDFENNRAFEEGFQFGYLCVIESMAHLIQFLVNPNISHSEVPYQSAQLIYKKIRPDLESDTKLLISICYTSLFFNNPGPAFFQILESASSNESGIKLFERYMRDYSRVFQEKQMPNYRMMEIMMDDFINKLQHLLGNDSIYIKKVIENCKYESKEGISTLLYLIYYEDLSKTESLDKLLNFYGYPAIDSANNEIVVPFNDETHKPYLETAALLSLELIVSRLQEKDNKTECIRYTICDRITRQNNKELIEEYCAEFQWKKQIPCLFSNGLNYWRLSDKNFIK